MFEDKYFNHKKMNVSKLLAYGFQESDEGFKYSTVILDNQFTFNITVSRLGNVHSALIEKDTDDEYILYRTENAVGSFVGTVKCECEKILLDISEKCFDPNIFKSKQANELMEYVRSQYGDELEFLWTKFPDNAIWRRKDTQKWYGALLTVSKKKLGLKTDEIVEIIDLRMLPELIANIVDNEIYFPGWHMNKKNWCTIILNGSVATEDICKRIDESYQLAIK